MITEINGLALRWDVEGVIRALLQLVVHGRDDIPYILVVEVGQDVVEPLDLGVDGRDALQSRTALSLGLDNRSLIAGRAFLEPGLVEDVAGGRIVVVNAAP